MEVTLNPGSPEAVESGCICPRSDNSHGKGIMGGAVYEGEVQFVINGACPLHGVEASDAS